MVGCLEAGGGAFFLGGGSGGWLGGNEGVLNVNKNLLLLPLSISFYHA